MKKYALVAAVAVMVPVIFIAGCGKKGASTGVAEVNGQAVSYEDFAKQMAQTPMAQQVLSQMLEERMLLALAEKNGVAPSDEQVTQRVEFLKKTADLDSQLKQAGLSIDDVKAQLKLQQARTNLIEKVSKTKVSDKEIKAYYDQRKALQFELPERRRVDLIVFNDKASSDKASKEIEAGATLEKIGETQSAEHSAMMTQAIPKSGPGIPADFAKAVFANEIGKISKPLKINVGEDRFIIMKPTAELPAVKISEKEAEPIIRGLLYLEKSAGDKDFEKTMNDARKEAKVTVSLKALEQVGKDFKNPPKPQFGMPMMQQAPAPQK